MLQHVTNVPITFQELVEKLSGMNKVLNGKAVTFSYTKMNTLSCCPAKWYYNYCYPFTTSQKKKMKSTGNIAGTFIHSAIENYMNAYNFYENKPVKDFDLVWAQTYFCRDFVNMGGIPNQAKVLIEDMREATNILVNSVCDWVVRDNLRVFNELKMAVMLDGSIKRVHTYPHEQPVLFYGAFDLTCLTPKYTKAIIIDYKTYSEANNNNAKDSEQLLLYKYFLYKWFNEVYNTRMVETGFGYITDAKIVRNRDALKETNIADAELKIFTLFHEYVKNLEDFIKLMQTPEKLRKNRAAHCKYCDYNDICANKTIF